MRLQRSDWRLAAWTCAGLLLAALTLLGLGLHVPHADSVGSVGRTNRFVALAAGAGAVYLLACALVLRGEPPRGAVWMVLGIALALRLPVLLAPPFLSSDVYRYVWDGRVQLAGINPYRHIPADPALLGLRDAAIYPHINRRDYAPTIYPPMAQAIYRAIASICQSVRAFKMAMVGFECLAVACLIGLLDAAGLPRARVLIYAWNPLAVWAFAGNGHVDAAAAGLIAAALLCAARRREGAAGAILAAATLVKFIPLALAPALWRPWTWRAPLAGLAVCLGLYACYLDAGWRVLGFLSSYGSEEGLSQGSGIWLLAGLGELFPLPGWAPRLYLLASACGLLALAAAMVARNRARLAVPENTIRCCRQAGWLALAFMLVITPHYSWYFPFLAIFATVAPARAVIWLSVAPLLLDLDPWHEAFVWRALVFGPTLVLAARDLRGRAVTRSTATLFAPSPRNV